MLMKSSPDGIRDNVGQPELPAQTSLGNAGLKDRLTASRSAHVMGARHRQEGKLLSAKKLLSQALAQDSSQPRYHHDFAMVLAELGEHDQAILGMREALRLRSGEYPSAINLGVLLEEAGTLC
jgi:Tfp pilus assembly protein PilF